MRCLYRLQHVLAYLVGLVGDTMNSARFDDDDVVQRTHQFAEGRFKHSVRLHIERGTNFPEKRVHKRISRSSRVFVDELLR